MKCSVHIVNEENTKDVIVKRKFVPMNVIVEREGQFVNAETKLPFTANKVMGILTTSKVNPCNDEPLPTRYYFGISDRRMTDDRFLKDNGGIEYDTEYPPAVKLDAVLNKWWYYAHPALDKKPTIRINGVFQELGDPILIEINEEGHCNPEPYHLWSGKFPDDGIVIISFLTPA